MTLSRLAAKKRKRLLHRQQKGGDDSVNASKLVINSAFLRRRLHLGEFDLRRCNMERWTLHGPCLRPPPARFSVGISIFLAGGGRPGKERWASLNEARYRPAPAGRCQCALGLSARRNWPYPGPRRFREGICP